MCGAASSSTCNPLSDQLPPLRLPSGRLGCATDSSTRAVPVPSWGSSHAAMPPTIEQKLVTTMRAGMFFSRLPLMNCALTAPILPEAARIPIAEVRAEVGKDSAAEICGHCYLH